MSRPALLALAICLLIAPSATAQTENPAPPKVTSAAAKSIARTSATIRGSVDPNGAATSYLVEYGTTSGYGLRTSARSAGAGDGPVAVAVALGGLTPSTTYHYRIVATNAAGIARSADRTFRTTPPPRPGVSLGPAGGITPDEVLLTGSVNPRGATTRYRFEYGLGKRLDRRTKLVSVGAGSSAVTVVRTVKLAPDRRYSYRLVAINSAGTTRSRTRTFRSPVSCATRYPPKLSVARASTLGAAIDVLAPISSRAAGRADIEYHAAGRRLRFTAVVDSTNRYLRFRRSVSDAQARLGTGILTIEYAGDGDTRPQTVRLRAASNKARLNLARPRIVGGRVQASGTISSRARGVVRLQLDYQLNCVTRVLHFRGTISRGRWRIDSALDPATLAEIAARTGTVHSYTLFTGYLPARMRGEMRAFQVLGNP